MKTNIKMKALEILKDIKDEQSYRFQKIINEAIEELEDLKHNDRLEELEKVILDYYLSIGYKVGVSGWGFYVVIESDYKSKQLVVYFRISNESNYEQILKIAATTTKEMFIKSTKHFKTEH